MATIEAFALPAKPIERIRNDPGSVSPVSIMLVVAVCIVAGLQVDWPVAGISSIAYWAPVLPGTGRFFGGRALLVDRVRFCHASVHSAQ